MMTNVAMRSIPHNTEQLQNDSGLRKENTYDDQSIIRF